MSKRAPQRATDQDRASTVSALDAALADGELSATEHSDRMRDAREATTITELRALLDDIQDPPPLTGTSVEPAQPPTQQPGDGGIPIRTYRLLIRTLTVVAIVALIWIGISAFGDDDPASDSAGESTSDVDADVPPLTIGPPPDMLTAEGIDGLVASMRTELGSTEVESLYLSHEHASFNQRRGEDPGSWSYYYDGFLGTPSYNDTGTAEPVVDLAALDSEAVEKLVASLSERLNVPDPTSTYVTVNEGYEDGSTQLWFYVSGASGTGYLTTDLDLERVGRIYRAT